ncbi:SDR family oxidoreductase [Mycolicibacterium llatzerense]|nr:SDR family oxidoreductase [Mycolicibacterium llatzerense]
MRQGDLGRLGQPDEVGAAVAFLVSPKASLTRTQIVVDGGVTSRQAQWPCGNHLTADSTICLQIVAQMLRWHHLSIAHEINVRSLISNEIADVPGWASLYPGVLDGSALPHRDDRTLLDGCVTDLVEYRPKSSCFQITDRGLG